MSKAPKRVKLVVMHWFDIEGDAGWGEGADQPPVVTQAGYIHARPNKKQKVPSWKIKSSQVEETPGGMTIIPAVNVVMIKEFGWEDVPTRKE